MFLQRLICCTHTQPVPLDQIVITSVLFELFALRVLVDHKGCNHQHLPTLPAQLSTTCSPGEQGISPRVYYSPLQNDRPILKKKK